MAARQKRMGSPKIETVRFFSLRKWAAVASPYGPAPMMATSQGIFLAVVWLSPLAVYEACWKSAMDVQGDISLRRGKNWDLVSLDFRIKAVNDAVAFQTSKRYAGTMGVGALNLPSVFFPDKTHLISTSPPVIELAGQRDPRFRLFTKLRKS